MCRTCWYQIPKPHRGNVWVTWHYDRACQAVAGHYLEALGFDPARAAIDAACTAECIDPVVRRVGKLRLRRSLLRLADCLQAVTDDGTGLGVTGQARAYRAFADADVIASHLN